MALFNFGKKKIQSCCCGCSTDEQAQTMSGCCEEFGEEIHSIKVLGAGCSSCHQQYDYAKKAVKNIGLSVEVEYITDMAKVMEYGVMSIPALVINEKVVSVGKVLKTADVENLLKK